MGSLLSYSVEIQISNNTQNITLKNPRTYFRHGYLSKPPLPELSPGSSDICHCSGDSQLWGVAGTTCVSGVLVYEADSFTLAVHFINTISKISSRALGLELSPGKAHLGQLETTYARMAHGTYSSSCPDTKFTRVILDQSHGTARLSHGPVRVMATMSSETRATLKVVLQEERGSGAEAGGEEPWDVKGDTSRRRENLRDLLRDLRGSPGSTWRT